MAEARGATAARRSRRSVLEGVPFTPVRGGTQNGIFCRVGRPKVTILRRRRHPGGPAAARRAGMGDHFTCAKTSDRPGGDISYWGFTAGHCPVK